MGSIFKVPGALLYIVGGIWGLIICLNIVASKFGTLVAIICFFFLPITIYVAPLYAGIADGNWYPLAIVYGTGIGAAILFGIGAAIDGNA